MAALQSSGRPAKTDTPRVLSGNQPTQVLSPPHRAKQLTSPHPGITQTSNVAPAPPGTRFHFTIDFENLDDEDLNLLLYCLILEEQTTVELSPAALGRRDQRGVTLCGPLRHKLGGAKPHGAGSVHIRVTKLNLRADQVARYRGKEVTDVLEGERLEKELFRRTGLHRKRTDRTMQELRAMLIYDAEDPRTPIQYPTFQWFQAGSQTPLKPTT